ncbi:MAG: alpha/beta hydrolase [Fretibacterium sp.]|nr:alpha/beta hydrolase [Fretibacterium sp.]
MGCEREELIRSFDGVELYRRFDVPDAYKGMVLLLHGLGGHSRRFDEATRLLNEAGWGVCRWDARGHGRSGGARAYLADFRHFIEDADFIVDSLKTELMTEKKAPLFMWGYSMGGFVAACWGILHPGKLSGQVFLGACAQPLPLYRNFRRLNLEKLALRLSPSIGSELLARDPRVGREYDRDPCVLRAFTNKLLHEVFILGVDWLQGELHRHSYPFLLLHGEEDRIVPVASSQFLHERSASPDKTLEILPGLWHDLLHEAGREEIIARIVRWMEERVQS